MEYSTADDIADLGATLREPAVTNTAPEKAMKTNPMQRRKIIGENKPHGRHMLRHNNT